MTQTAAQPEANAPARDDAPIIEAKEVFKTYRLGRVDVPVLRGASLSAREGECVAVLGASGSGKSTLLHLLGGLDRADRQPIDVDAANHVAHRGRSIDGFSAHELDQYRRSTVGFVFQFYHLLPELTVLQNVLIAAMVLHGRVGYMGRSAALRERATQLLDRFGLAHRLKHRPVELSGGERQRVAIARALINQPELLLADEPTGNLDQKTGGSILDAMMALRSETKQTMVIVTHDQSTAARADRVVRLVDGKVAR
ncbi:MAG: ABC transporter ATP-binding protein [Phycisphaerales bacterium]|nr:ABC transporter ATP-binding protein [Phycisphaerales bacterium]